LSTPSAPRWVRHSYLSKVLRYTPYTCGSSGSQLGGQLQSINKEHSTPSLRYFAYYLATSVLGRENTSNISNYHLAFLATALNSSTKYNLGALIARRLATRGPIYGGIIVAHIIDAMGLLFLILHESLIMIMLMMIHHPGIITRVGIDLHLGQKPKLGGGGGYTKISLIYTSYSVGTLYIHVLLSLFFFVVLVLFLLSKTQKDQFFCCCFSLFASLVF
jgi:hypothetical protein